MIFTRLIKNRPAGVSLLIAIVFVSAIVLVSVGLTETFINATRDSRDFYAAEESQYAAQGISNLVLQQIWKSQSGVVQNRGVNVSFKSTDSGVAPTTMSTLITDFLKSFKFCKSNACPFEFRGISRPAATLTNCPGLTTCYSSTGSYVDAGNTVGTGDAASDCNSDMDSTGIYNNIDFAHADNPCHWNILKMGETHEIPLYYADGSGATVTFSSSDSVLLRVRAPCKDVQPTQAWCANGRYSLFYGTTKGGLSSDPALNDDTLVVWQITGDPPAGTNYSSVLFPRTVSTNGVRVTDLTQNTEITASKINDAILGAAGAFVVLNRDTSGADIWNLFGVVNAFLIGGSAASVGDNAWNSRTLSNPKLQIQLVAPPRVSGWTANNGKEVPFLEYQVLANKPFASEKIVSQASVTIGSVTQTVKVEKKYPFAESLFTFQQSR